MNHPIKIGDQQAWHSGPGEGRRYDYDLNEESTVIDIGAYEGEFAQTIYDKFYCRVFVFEPTDAIAALNNTGTKISILRAAAWTHEGKITLGGESFWVSSKERYNLKEFDCVAIDKWYPQDEVDLCKINIEGGEYELLNYMMDNALHLRTRNLQVQFHMVEGEDSQAAYDQVTARLSESHACTWRVPFVWENWELKPPAHV